MEFKFNASNYDDPTGFEPIPEGTYICQVDKVEYVQKDADSKYIKVEMSVLGGDQNGKKLFDMHNMVNKSPKAEEIGRKRFAQFMKSTGVMEINGQSDLFTLQGKRCECDVVIYEDNYNGQKQMKNKVKTYWHEGNKNRQETKAPASGNGDEIF